MDIKNFHFLYTRVEDALGFYCDIVTLPIYIQLTFSECQKLYKIHKNSIKFVYNFCTKFTKKMTFSECQKQLSVLVKDLWPLIKSGKFTKIFGREKFFPFIRQNLKIDSFQFL